VGLEEDDLIVTQIPAKLDQLGSVTRNSGNLVAGLLDRR
jgi:hypothetical protein